MSQPAPQFTQDDLRQWKLIADFRARLEALAQDQPQHPAWQDKRRKLQQFDYLSLFLFTLVNPVIESFRAASAASGLRRVQQEVCSPSTAASCLSEAQHLLDPQLLENLIASLSEQGQGLQENPVSEEQRQAGILGDQGVQPASRTRYQTGRLRLITLRKPGGTVMRLISNTGPAEMNCRDIQTLYRRRWKRRARKKPSSSTRDHSGAECFRATLWLGRLKRSPLPLSLQPFAETFAPLLLPTHSPCKTGITQRSAIHH